jgi:hypothetical protein
MVLLLFNDKNYVHVYVLVCLTVIRAPERHDDDDDQYEKWVDITYNYRIGKTPTGNSNKDYQSVVNMKPKPTIWSIARCKKWASTHNLH